MKTDVLSITTRSLLAAVALAGGLFWQGAAHALTADEAYSVSAGENDDRIAALQKLQAKGEDPALSALLEALMADSVKVAGKKVYIVDGEEAKDAATGQTVTLPDDAEDVVNNTRMSSEIEAALAAGKLSSPDASVREEAIDSLASAADESKLPVIDKALAAETNAKLKARLMAVRAKALLSANDPARRIEAAEALASLGNPEARATLMERMADGGETDPKVQSALRTALDSVNTKLAWGERAGVGLATLDSVSAVHRARG